MFYLSRENNQTKENLYPKLFFFAGKCFAAALWFFYIYFANYLDMEQVTTAVFIFLLK